MARLLKNIVGVVISALIVIVLYLGPAIIGLIYGLIPQDMVESLATPERDVVFDGAWEISDFEREGDMDGDLDVVVDPNLALGEVDQEASEGDGSSDAEVDAPSGEAGGDGEPGAADSMAVEREGAPPSGKGKGTSRGEGSGAGGAETPATRSGTTRRRSRKQCPKSFDGIRRRRDGVYEVDRSLVSYHTSSVKHFNELGWSQANKKGKGWYVTGFNCFGPLWHAGIRRRDLIMRVNGKRTNNMMQVMLLWPKVKAQKHFEVEIERNDKPITLRYEVVR